MMKAKIVEMPFRNIIVVVRPQGSFILTQQFGANSKTEHIVCGSHKVLVKLVLPDLIRS